MSFKSKRGQIGVTEVLGGLLGLFLLIVIIVVGVNISNDVPWGDAIANSFIDVANGAMNVFGPLFNVLLGFGDDSSINFLKVMTFILIAIILINLLGFVNIFGGESKKGDLANLAIGIIISIIGVRFMPEGSWLSLAAPSSAFVATILVAVPFAALFFVTMKLKSRLGKKLMWFFYMLFLSYLIFVAANTAIISIYTIFILLSIIMAIFDSTIMGFVRKEKEQMELNDTLTGLSLQQKHKLREEIRSMMTIAGDVNAPKTDRMAAERKLSNLRKRYGQDLVEI